MPIVRITGCRWSEDDMVRILLEPKNSIVKQYQKLFELDGVDLSFDDEASESDRG